MWCQYTLSWLDRGHLSDNGRDWTMGNGIQMEIHQRTTSDIRLDVFILSLWSICKIENVSRITAIIWLKMIKINMQSIDTFVKENVQITHMWSDGKILMDILQNCSEVIAPYITRTSALILAMWVNSLRLSDAYMRPRTGSPLFQVMAFHLLGTKPFPKPMMTYWQLNH